MSGITREDRKRNEYIKGSLGVTSIVNKIRENKYWLFGNILGIKKTEAVSLIKKMYVNGI